MPCFITVYYISLTQIFLDFSCISCHVLALELGCNLGFLTFNSRQPLGPICYWLLAPLAVEPSVLPLNSSSVSVPGGCISIVSWRMNWIHMFILQYRRAFQMKAITYAKIKSNERSWHIHYAVIIYLDIQSSSEGLVWLHMQFDGLNLGSTYKIGCYSCSNA